VVGLLQVVDRLRCDGQEVGQRPAGLDRPEHRARDHVGHALGGQQVGGGRCLQDAQGGQRRVGWTVVSLLGFRQGVPDDDQLHGAGT